jgi:hypothetical protein
MPSEAVQDEGRSPKMVMILLATGVISILASSLVNLFVTSRVRRGPSRIVADLVAQISAFAPLPDLLAVNQRRFLHGNRTAGATEPARVGMISYADTDA